MVNWSPGITLETIERQVILAAYRHFRGNKTATANSLGIAIRTLDNKLEKYQGDDDTMEKNDAQRKANADEFLKRQRGFQTGVDGALVPITERRIYDTPDATLVAARKATLERPAQGRMSNDGETEAGLRMESASDDSAQQPVPLPLGKEVQGMSSRQAAGNRNGKRR